MKSNFPIDELYANEISALLKPLPSLQIQEYFDDLIKKRRCSGLRVKQNVEFGKGVFTDMKFEEEELILKDQMIVGAQHSSNKIDCHVCSFCFKFIGSVELQIGRKLYLQEIRISSNDECHSLSSNEDDNSWINNHGSVGPVGECSTSSSANKIPLSKEIVNSLMNGELRLPHSQKFFLPSAIPCAGGCGEAFYCSKSCADMDWQHSHSLLCTGDKLMSSCRKALSEFVDHANDTNDIFLLAAKTIAFTILRYRKLKEAHLTSIHFSDAILNGSEAVDLPLLLEAWKPISMGYKRRWWDCIALPDDVEESEEVAFRTQIKEMAFESLQLLKEAIFDKECAPLFSLEIYGNIIGMFELNNLDISTHLNFHLVNSDLVVASPVEDYFLYIDDLPDAQKKEAEAITKPILDALGEDYSICCQDEDCLLQMNFIKKVIGKNICDSTGTLFDKSCMNHSCNPNAKAFKREEDQDGQATIIALRSIEVGEEVTISYIDEELPYEERQALLADYGFECKCSRCSNEA